MPFYGLMAGICLPYQNKKTNLFKITTMNYQSKNYITTSVMITCASSEMSKKKRNTAQNLLPVDAVQELELLLENTASKN
jgi:hypothetical protein